MSIITAHPRRIKATRRTPRPAAPFGAGIFARPTRFEPSIEDCRWAAQAFADPPAPDYDRLAGEAAYVDAVGAMMPLPVDICRSCGQPAEVDRDGLCLDCEAIADRLATPY